jgi:hypothetical protein
MSTMPSEMITNVPLHIMNFETRLSRREITNRVIVKPTARARYQSAVHSSYI